MALRTILKDDEILHKKARAVVSFDSRLHTLLDDMAETLHEAAGAGLAAPQVGVLRRVCIVEADDKGCVELINPEIIASEGEQEGLEGCLSIPGFSGWVKRPMKVTVRAQDRKGERFEMEAEGFKARAVCHELDHLRGRLYTELAEAMYENDSIPDELLK